MINSSKWRLLTCLHKPSLQTVVNKVVIMVRSFRSNSSLFGSKSGLHTIFLGSK